MGRKILVYLAFGALVCLPTAYGSSSFTITPTFGSSITGDTNAVAIEATINSAIQAYEDLFTNPINVTIQFNAVATGLGQSSKDLYSISYANFYSAYSANSPSDPAAQTALSSDMIPNQTDNPVTGNANLYMTTADIRALGITCVGCAGPSGFDGIINLNTTITDPGTPTSTGTYSLLAVTEHEIDEVLGLGSSLGQSFQTIGVQPEDLFRYDSSGNRSYTTDTSASAYFSLNGTTTLAQFDNQNDGGDWGDWQSNPLPDGVLPEVQDAFATPGSAPSLGVELTALEAIGYDSATPEPGTFGLLGVSLGVLGLAGWRQRRSA